MASALSGPDTLLFNTEMFFQAVELCHCAKQIHQIQHKGMKEQRQLVLITQQSTGRLSPWETTIRATVHHTLGKKGAPTDS